MQSNPPNVLPTRLHTLISKFFISIYCTFPYNFHNALRSLNLFCVIVHFALCTQN